VTLDSPIITGIGSVTPYGPLGGPIPKRSIEPSVITAWPTAGVRRAFLVPPFRPASVVPGLQTRRLDRLSSWALVAAALAIKDAGMDLAQEDRSRIAVIFGSGLGCIELTEAFYRSAAVHGWSGTDPSTFPETLANAPASHVAIANCLRGPNIMVSSKGLAGECALIQASLLLRYGQADVAIVLAGDTLTRTVYEWYEAAGVLSPACFNALPMLEYDGFMPGEGITALVLEAWGRRTRPQPYYAGVGPGHWANGGESASVMRKVLNGSAVSLVICASDGSPCAAHRPGALIREVIGDDVAIAPRNAVAAGLTDASGLLHLILALGGATSHGQALLLGRSGGGGFAAIRLELP